MGRCISYLLTSGKPVTQLREKFFTVFCWKLVRLIKMCLNETYSKVRIGKLLSDKFPIQNGLKQEMLYRHCFTIYL
jgi:hypothetical protein